MRHVHVLTLGGLLVTSPAALAGFSGTMYNVLTDPASWATTTPIASQNAATDGFNYNPSSGFAASFGSVIVDRTDVATDVYRVNSTTFIGAGPNQIALLPGSLIFAYRLRLVDSFPGLTVGSLNEAQVIGAPDFGFGQNAMAASLINAQGFVTTSHGNNPLNGNIDDAAEFGSSVDFEWGNVDTDHLDNLDTITMLLFTDPADIGRGVLNLSAPPGQTGGITGVAQAGEAPPVLIPIIPTPGAFILGAFGLSAVAVRRRTR